MTLWDTGNLERAGIRNVTRSYFRYAVGVILVYDVSCRESFDALYDWMYYIKDSVSQHLPKRPITFVVWGNNKDQCSDCVSVDHIKSFLESQGLNQEDCYNVNTCTGLHVFESYHDLLERVHRAFRQQSWDKHRTVSQTYTDNKSICSC